MRTKLLLLLFLTCPSCFSQYYKEFNLTEESYHGKEYIHGFLPNGLPLLGRHEGTKTGVYVYARKHSNYRGVARGGNPLHLLSEPFYELKGREELIDFLATVLDGKLTEFDKDGTNIGGWGFDTYFNIWGDIQEVDTSIRYPFNEALPQGVYISLENYYKIEQFILENCKWSFVPNLSIDGAKYLTLRISISTYEIYNRWLEKNKKRNRIRRCPPTGVHLFFYLKFGDVGFYVFLCKINIV